MIFVGDKIPEILLELGEDEGEEEGRKASALLGSITLTVNHERGARVWGFGRRGFRDYC